MQYTKTFDKNYLYDNFQTIQRSQTSQMEEEERNYNHALGISLIYTFLNQTSQTEKERNYYNVSVCKFC